LLLRVLAWLPAIIAGVLFISHHRDVPSRQLSQISQESSTPEATISRLEQTNADLQRETERLHQQVAALTADASNSSRVDGRKPANTAPLASGGASSLEEAGNQRKAWRHQLHR
jgi:hypothetical protein